VKTFPSMKTTALPVFFLLAASALSAQDGASLSQFFEGKQVVVKIDMPGSQEGLDLYPQKPNPFDAKAYGSRMKKYPVSLRSGDTVVVTTVKVKDKAIEFQLGGGGFGTFGDNTDTSGNFTPASKSQREKDLEDQLKHTDDRDERDRIQRKLDDIRRQRERDDQRNRALAERTAAIKRDRVADERAKGGSRFNLKYDAKVPANLTPQDVMAVLAQYVSFSPQMAGQPAATPTATLAPASHAPGAPSSLSKGMREEQVRAILGPPTSVSDANQGGLQVHSEIFVQGNSTVHTQFVNGVLVSYSIDVR
jgi:hypothetical protein